MSREADEKPKKLEVCRKCGVELSFKELRMLVGLCFICDRNMFDLERAKDRCRDYD